MYEAFDSFLETDTWHTHSDEDEARFYEILNDVIDEPEFSPDAMAEHFQKVVDNPEMQPAIDEYEYMVSVIMDFLEVTDR